MIKVVKFNDLDVEKYNTLVQNSAQKSIFCELEFLKCLNGNQWEFLVYNDFEAVMPVPFVTKFGNKIVARPWGMQQCGIYSKIDNTQLNTQLFNYLEKNYTVNYYPFNTKNNFEKEILKLKNLYIPKNNYETVRKNYTSDRRRNVRILPDLKEKISVHSNQNLAEIKDFYFKNILGIKDSKKPQFLKALENLEKSNYLNIWILKFENEIASVATLAENEDEMHAFSLINDEKFKKFNTASILIDQILQKKIHEKKFSFMGGNIPHIYEFFRRFSPVEENFAVIQRNKLETIKRKAENFLRF